MNEKIYTIAKITSEVYGHGDTGKVLRICGLGAYETWEYPPCFTNIAAAENFKINLPFEYNYKVVELNLIRG